jgi:hypothetical protein
MQDEHAHNSDQEMVAVVIPIYKSIPTELERIGFKQCNEQLKNHKRIIVAPENLDLSAYLSYEDLTVIRFAPSYFIGLKGYNRLLLSMDFYKEFIPFRYILICQLDTFVFSDQLNYWCEKNYDYIGAPWLHDSKRIFLNIAAKISVFDALRLLIRNKYRNAVGNGGFSLRKVSACMDILSKAQEYASKWTANEDYFWGFCSNLTGNTFNIPNFIEASSFCIELQPHLCMNLNNGKLPFGLHAWEKHNLNFWKPYIKGFGYEL